jgi:hypothetical protein
MLIKGEQWAFRQHQRSKGFQKTQRGGGVMDHVNSGGTSSTGRAKKDWGKAESCWEGVVDMGMAF